MSSGGACLCSAQPLPACRAASLGIPALGVEQFAADSTGNCHGINALFNDAQSLTALSRTEIMYAALVSQTGVIPYLTTATLTLTLGQPLLIEWITGDLLDSLIEFIPVYSN